LDTHKSETLSPLIPRHYSPPPDSSSSPWKKKKYPTSLDLIGNTPLVDITAVCNPKNPKTVILGKAEFINPGYSMKDRITAHIFSKAEREGVLKEGMTVVAASSGNTGCSVAMMCAIKGYKAVVITNEKCSGEKRAAIKVRIVSFSCVISYTRLTQPFSPNPTQPHPTPPNPTQPHPNFRHTARN